MKMNVMLTPLVSFEALKLGMPLGPARRALFPTGAN
jgi:hypothetical protein